MTATSNTLAQCAAPRRPSIWQRLMRARALRRQRRDLRALDDYQLRDIGVSAADRERELRRPVWRAPDHWRS